MASNGTPPSVCEAYVRSYKLPVRQGVVAAPPQVVVPLYHVTVWSYKLPVRRGGGGAAPPQVVVRGVI